MQSKTRWAVLGGLALVGLLGWAFWPEPDSVDEESASAAISKGEVEHTASQDMGSLRRALRRQAAQSRIEIAMLRKSVEELREAKPVRDESQTTEAGSAPAAEPVDLANQTQVTREREELARSMLLNTLADTHHKEPVDAEWSEQYERELRASFDTPAGAAFELATVDCRSRLCRLELRAQADTEDDAVVALLDDPAYAGGSYVHPGAESGTTVIYAVRTGEFGLLNDITRSVYGQL